MTACKQGVQQIKAFKSINMDISVNGLKGKSEKLREGHLKLRFQSL